MPFKRDIKGWCQSRHMTCRLAEVRWQEPHFWPWGQTLWCLNRDATYSFSQPFLRLVRDSWLFTTWSCPDCLTVPLGKVTFLHPGTLFLTNYCCDYDAGKIVSIGFWILNCVGIKKSTVNSSLTRHPTLLVKVDNAAVTLTPGAQVHSSSFSDVGLAGVGFRGTD